MEYVTSYIAAKIKDKEICIIPLELDANDIDAFKSGGVAIRNRHVLEIMAVAIRPKTNTQIGRGASVYSALKESTLRFPCKILELPQHPTQEHILKVKRKEHSLRNGISFPILILNISEVFGMK